MPTRSAASETDPPAATKAARTSIWRRVAGRECAPRNTCRARQQILCLRTDDGLHAGCLPRSAPRDAPPSRRCPMDLCLYTDSVPELSFEAALDLAARMGCASIEIAGGGQSSARHLRLGELLGDRRKRSAFAAAFASRGLRIAALNCSAWPLHPVNGPAHESIIRDTIRLAGELGVETVVSMSGTPGDGVGASTVDWVFYPWPADAVALQARQWEAAIPFWQE